MTESKAWGGETRHTIVLEKHPFLLVVKASTNIESTTVDLISHVWSRCRICSNQKCAAEERALSVKRCCANSVVGALSLELRAVFAAWTASVDVNSPSRWRSGDGKIISVAEEKKKKKKNPYLRDLSQTRQGPGPKKQCWSKACKHLAQWDSWPWNQHLFIFSPD